jgi:hypothetical protein
MTVACWGGFEAGRAGVLEYGIYEEGAEYSGRVSVYMRYG